METKEILDIIKTLKEGTWIKFVHKLNSDNIQYLKLIQMNTNITVRDAKGRTDILYINGIQYYNFSVPTDEEMTEYLLTV